MLLPNWLLCCSVELVAAALSAFTSTPLQHAVRLGPGASLLQKNPLFSLHRSLIEIESTSGSEHVIGKYLESYLTAHNFTVEKQAVKSLLTSSSIFGQAVTDERFNILAYVGEKRNTRVLLSSHIDAVPPYFPYEIHKGDQVWGRGSVDAKACVAAQIQAMEELLTSGDVEEGDVGLLFVVGEEVSGDGMRKANDFGLEWEAVIFGEPTELKLASGHKGGVVFTITATGKAGHSGYPWLGENANSMLLPALLALEKLELPHSEKYGNSTLNIGKVEGGVAANVIAESAKADVMIRVADGSAEHIKSLVREVVKDVDDRLEIHFRAKGYGPVYIDSDVEGLALCRLRSWMFF